MRRLARRAFCGVLAAVLAAAAVCPAYAIDPAQRQDELQVAAAVPLAPAPVPAYRVMGTRFVIGLDSKVDYQVFSLSNPNRVIVELPEVNVQLPTLAGNMPAGLVKSFRAVTITIYETDSRDVARGRCAIPDDALDRRIAGGQGRV